VLSLLVVIAIIIILIIIISFCSDDAGTTELWCRRGVPPMFETVPAGGGHVTTFQ